MTVTEAKKKIDKTGVANLTFINDIDGLAFIGNVTTMTTRNGRVRLSWKLPSVEHIVPFDRAFLNDGKSVLWEGFIKPLRLDSGTKKFELDWDI